MTKPDPEFLDDGPSDGVILLKRGLISVIGGLLLIFLAGIIAGYSSVMIENRSADLVDAAVLGALLLVTALTAFGMWRLWPRTGPEPVAPSIRKARFFLILAVGLSVVLGFILAAANPSSTAVFSNAPVGAATAAVAIVLWVIVAPVLIWLWWRKIDEHEADAYRDGAMIAIHVYMFAAPGWWMATRAGWLPPQDPMVVLLGVCVVWSIVWFVRRYF